MVEGMYEQEDKEKKQHGIAKTIKDFTVVEVLCNEPAKYHNCQ